MYLNSADGSPYTVLLTGFGPYAKYKENPAWLAVKPLHNTVLNVDPSPEDLRTDSIPRAIQVSALEIPFTYEAVTDIVPNLHARPPKLPDSDDSDAPTAPNKPYDFIFHIGLAGRGGLRMERVGHKIGYHMKDASGHLAPVVSSSPKDFSRRTDDLLIDETQRETLALLAVEAGGSLDNVVRANRGFGKAYELFADEIATDIDVMSLVQDLKRSGIEDIYTSMDCGHHVADYMYFCSLAEAKRTANPYERRRNTQVLFLHCPPPNYPLSIEEVTESIKRIIIWVCSDIQSIEAMEAETFLAEAASQLAG